MNKYITVEISKDGDSVKRGLIKLIKCTLAVSLAALACFSLVKRIPQCFGARDTALAAAAFTLSDGSIRAQAAATSPEREQETTEPKGNDDEKPAAVVNASAKSRDKSGYYDTYADHSGEEKLPIISKTIPPEGVTVGGASVKNRTGVDIDFNSLLDKPLDFKVNKNSTQPQVLIYHTHTSEGYLDENVDYCYESYYSRTQNNDFNVVAVGEAIARTLEKNGIRTLHDSTVHDSTYNGAYYRSAATAGSDMDEYGEISVVLDIHRDAIGTDEYKVKPVFGYNGRQAAQIMILSGCDYYNEMDFPDWEKNLSLALKLQSAAEQSFPGMTRPLNVDYFSYNEPLCPGSLLIEVGAEGNSIDEAVYSGELLGEALAKALS